MSKMLNDFELKAWLNEWGKYFPEVDIFKVRPTYYKSSLGIDECTKDDNYYLIVYKVSCTYDKEKYFNFEFDYKEHDTRYLIDIFRRDIYGNYYSELNKVRYGFFGGY